MCQSKPGNRCASHSKSKLLAAHKAVDNFLGERNPRDLNPDERQALTELKQKVSVEQLNYDSTPTGQKLLLREIDKAFIKDWDDGKVIRLEQRRRKAAALRARRNEGVRELKKARVLTDKEVAECKETARKYVENMSDTPKEQVSSARVRREIKRAQDVVASAGARQHAVLDTLSRAVDAGKSRQASEALARIHEEEKNLLVQNEILRVLNSRAESSNESNNERHTVACRGC